MRNFFITVDADGKVTTDLKQLGYGAEHNAATLIFEFTDDAEEVFSSIQYFRVVIDGHYSSDLYRSEDGVVYTVPQECMRPPRVQCQLVGYIAENDEPKVIVKSEVFGFDVDRSEVPFDVASTRPNVLEQAMEVCRSSSESASQSAKEAGFSAQAAMLDAETASNCSKKAQESAETSQQCAENLLQMQWDVANVSNALKRNVTGSVVAAKDVSPLAHTVKVKMVGAEGGTGESLTKTATLNTMGANVTLNNPSNSVRIELHGGAYCVGGIVPIMSGEDVGDMLGTAIVPTYSYGETPGIMNLSYTVSGNVLSWVGTLTTNSYDNAEVYEVSGSYTLSSADQKITGFCQVFGLNNDNPHYQTPEYDNLDVTVSVYEGGMPTVKVYGKNLFNNDTTLISNHSFINKDDGNKLTYYGYVLPLVKGKYTMHAEGNAHSFIYGALMDADGIRQEKVNIVAQNTLKTVTFDALDGYSLFMYFGVNDTLSVAQTNFEKFDIQLEVGSTATAYESYKEPVTYTADENGNIDIPSQYPSMTVIPDSDGAELSVEYNRDINKAFQELQNVVAQLQTLAVATVPIDGEEL